MVKTLSRHSGPLTSRDSKASAPGLVRDCQVSNCGTTISIKTEDRRTVVRANGLEVSYTD